MPVFGADAVHGQVKDGQFRVYLGESKMHARFKGAALDAANSISNAKEKYSDEFDLLDSFMDFPNIDEVDEIKLLSLLNPFTNDDLPDAIHSPCFIGFSEPNLIKNACSEDDFISNYCDLSCDYIADFFSMIERNDLSINEVSLLMLPFSSIDQLVEGFITYMGIQNLLISLTN